VFRRIIFAVVALIVVVGVVLALSGNQAVSGTIVDQSKSIHDFGTNI
jgi:hypothetical protein